MIYHLNKCSCGATITGKNRICCDCEAARNVARIKARNERRKAGVLSEKFHMEPWQVRLCLDKPKNIEFCPICGIIKRSRRHLFCSRVCQYLWMHNQYFRKKFMGNRPFTSGCYAHLLDSLEAGQTIAEIAKDTNRTPEQVSTGIATAHRLGREGIRRMFIQERSKDENDN
jgi:hypothetical protein